MQLNKAGKTAEALAEFRKSSSLFQQLATADPQDVDGKLCASSAQLDVGRQLLLAGDLEGAEGELQRSLSVAEPLACPPVPVVRI